MNIDPKLLSTGLGATIGLALTRTALKNKKDRTWGRLAGGAGAGGLAGYLASDYLQSEPPGSVPTGVPSQDVGLYSRLVGSTVPSGRASQVEQDAFRASGGSVFPEIQQEGLMGKIQQRSLRLVHDRVSQLNTLRGRAEQLNGALQNPNLSPQRKALVTKALESTNEGIEEHKSAINRTMWSRGGAMNVAGGLMDYLSGG